MKLLENLPCSHNLIPDFSGEFLADIQTQIHIELPYPIHKPFRYIEDDVIDVFHSDVEHHSNQLQTFCKEFPLVQDRIINQSFDNSHARIPQGLLNFCNTEKCEKPFPCDYNPYYASGFLEHYCLNNKCYLIRPDSRNKLRVTDIAKPWKSSSKINLESSLRENIHSIKSRYSNSDISLLLQLETEVNMLQIRDINENANINWNKKFKRKILDSKGNKTQIGVILANTKFNLYDIETNKRINFNNFDIYSGFHLDFPDENTVALLNQKCLKIIDQRSEDYKIFQPEVDVCNGLCSVKFDDNVIYVASRHHLLRTDVRFFKNVDFCTHLMKKSPCYMDLISTNGNKFLCLSSQKVDEKVLFTGNPISSLPFYVPNICDSLTKCRTKKDVLLIDRLDERLQKSTGGIKLLCENNDIFLYTVNSLGDIFKQKISEEFNVDGTDSINHLYKWISRLPEPSKTLYLTDIANLSDARFTLNKRILDEQLIKFGKKSKKATLFLNHYNNIYKKSNLGCLATNFVSIWEEEDEEKEHVDLVPEVAPLEKVSSWIESSYFIDE